MSSSRPQGSDGKFLRTRATPHPKAHPGNGYRPAKPVPPDKLKPDEERYALALFSAEGRRLQQDIYLEVFPSEGRLARATIHAKSSLLAKKVSLRVKQLQDAVASPKIADAIERQEFWTGVMRSTKDRMRDKLSASELLGRKQGDFKADEEKGGGPVTNKTLVLVGFTEEQLRELLGRME